MSIQHSKQDMQRNTRGFCKQSIFALCMMLCVLFAGVYTSHVVAQEAQPNTPLEKLIIASGDKRHTFLVEVMRDDESRTRGLMHRRHLPQDRGMLFDFKTEQTFSMWMKNTYIPLDMLFIRASGEISHIAENTEPHSTRLIPSGGAVLGVLEVNAGVVKNLQIKVGDRVLHETFKTQIP